MSIASPTLRSSSSTEPALSLSSCATDMWARPSTAEMLTGTSKTGARSDAVLVSPSWGSGACSPGPSSLSVSGASATSAPAKSAPSSGSSAIGCLFGEFQRLGVQALGREGGVQGGGHAGGRLLGIEGRAALAPFEDEGGARQVGVGLHHHLARIAGGLGRLVEGELDAVGDLGRRANQQAGVGLDLPAQGLEGGLDGS